MSDPQIETPGDWFADHPRWCFVFTPKHTSWLNQVETYRQTARPFSWKYTGKGLAA